MPLRLRPTAPIAQAAILVGDPGRALLLAQSLLEQPKMSNHARGLWGYSGDTAAGRPLSIQSTGMGGPSAAIVLQELSELGVRRAVRVGTCGALRADLGHGVLVVAGDAIAEDGASRALGAGEIAEPDAGLTRRLAAALPGAPEPGRVVTTDLFYDGDSRPEPPEAWLERGAVAVEMEAATLFILGERIGVATACLLAVSDTFEDVQRRRIDDEALADAVARMGSAAAAALGG